VFLGPGNARACITLKFRPWPLYEYNGAWGANGFYGPVNAALHKVRPLPSLLHRFLLSSSTGALSRGLVHHDYGDFNWYDLCDLCSLRRPCSFFSHTHPYGSLDLLPSSLSIISFSCFEPLCALEYNSMQTQYEGRQ